MDESKRRVADKLTVWLLVVGLLLAVGLSWWTLFYRQEREAIEKVGQRDATFESDQKAKTAGQVTITIVSTK